MPDRPWGGVFPALTTPFTSSFALDLPALDRQIELQLSAGVDGLVVLGSLGENGTLSAAEKREVLLRTAAVAAGRVPVLAGVAETTTAAACETVRAWADLGADGFMVLPAMQYAADSREAMAHLRAIAAASPLPIMIYNNPVAYRVDVTPAMFAELADEPKFVALKESSDNVRRITDIVNAVGARYRIFAGVDDLALECFLAGAVGWVAGLVCAFPHETVALHRLAQSGRWDEARAIYRWFTPMLHLDTHVKFVQYIKLAAALAGTGTETVRPPRLPLVGEERAAAERTVREALASRPPLPSF